MAGGVRRVRGVQAAHDRAGARRGRTRDADRDEPRVGTAGARPRARAEGAGKVDRRDGHHGADRVPGTAPGLAARQRPRGAGAVRLRGSLRSEQIARPTRREERLINGEESTAGDGVVLPAGLANHSHLRNS